MTAPVHRGLPWWPIRVDARIEPDGIRVVGSQALDVLPVGSLVGWDRVTGLGNGEPHLLDEQGLRFKLGRRPVALRLSDRPSRTADIRAANAWFGDPTRRFRVVIPPDAQRRHARSVVAGSLYMLCLTTLPLLLARGPVSSGVEASEIEKRADLALNAFLFLCACGSGLALVMAGRALWAIPRRWHAEELTETGVRIRLRDQTEVVPWQDCSHVRHAVGVLTLHHTDGRQISVEQSARAERAISAKLSARTPLMSGFFLSLLLVALIGPLGTGWMFRWLELPADVFGWRKVVFLQTFMLLFPGLFAFEWWMKRRNARPTPATRPHQ